MFEQPEENPLILNTFEKDPEGLAIISIIPNNEELKDIKKKITFDEQITVKISDLEKPDTILTNDQESWKITIKELEQKNEEGYLITV